MNVRIKRVYERSDEEDGMRVLVCRLWPRGMTKAKARVDLWLKDIAPGTELCKWFGHDPDKWTELTKRYHAELRNNGGQIGLLKREIKKSMVTLSRGAKDEEHNAGNRSSEVSEPLISRRLGHSSTKPLNIGPTGIKEDFL